MGLKDYFNYALEFFDSRTSLENLKLKFKERFDIPDINMPLESATSDMKTGYLRLPKKDDVSRTTIEKVVLGFYSGLGFKFEKTNGDNNGACTMRFSREKSSRDYIIKITEKERNYELDINFTSKSFK